VFGRTGAVTAQSGDYTVVQITGAAPLASPVLTGTPTAPTQAALTNNTDIATTAYADLAVGVETTRATTAEGLKAPLAAPSFTGTVNFAGNENIASGQVLQWNADTGLSRISAGVIGVGTGAAASIAGTLWATTLKLGSNGLSITQNGSFAFQLLASSTFTVASGSVFAVGGNAVGTSDATFYIGAIGSQAIEIVGFAGQTGNVLTYITSGGNVVWGVSANGSYLLGPGSGASYDLNLSRIAAATLTIGNGTVGDFSGTLKLGNEILTAAAPTVAAAQVGLGSTTSTTVGAVGGASALPGLPVGYLIVNVAGTAYKVPYYNS
jgi:hypothetical protein